MFLRFMTISDNTNVIDVIERSSLEVTLVTTLKSYIRRSGISVNIVAKPLQANLYLGATSIQFMKSKNYFPVKDVVRVLGEKVT